MMHPDHSREHATKARKTLVRARSRAIRLLLLAATTLMMIASFGVSTASAGPVCQHGRWGSETQHTSSWNSHFLKFQNEACLSVVNGYVVPQGKFKIWGNAGAVSYRAHVCVTEQYGSPYPIYCRASSAASWGETCVPCEILLSGISALASDAFGWVVLNDDAYVYQGIKVPVHHGHRYRVSVWDTVDIQNDGKGTFRDPTTIVEYTVP